MILGIEKMTTIDEMDKDTPQGHAIRLELFKAYGGYFFQDIGSGWRLWVGNFDFTNLPTTSPTVGANTYFTTEDTTMFNAALTARWKLYYAMAKECAVLDAMWWHR